MPKKQNVRVMRGGSMRGTSIRMSGGGGGMKRCVQMGHCQRLGQRNNSFENNCDEPVGAVVSCPNPITGGALHMIKFAAEPKKRNIKLSY